jgi:glyoxylase-like metal-dependent hydrolase (beta-lactamase superfamily II)
MRIMAIHCIDLHFQDTPGIIAAYLVLSGSEAALIETGPATCRPALLEGLRTHGIKPSDIGKVFVTHIHLDHAGDAGWWAQQGAKVYAHPKGSPHIIDPSKLIESATRIYQEKMPKLWGEILPAPAEQVTALSDGDQVQVGEETITAWDTPGHARHHHAFVMGSDCFTGDVAGVRLEQSPYLSVAAAPPQFEPPAYLESVQRLKNGNFERLHLTHFGTIADVSSHLETYAQRIQDVTDALTQDQDPHHFIIREEQLAAKLQLPMRLLIKYDLANGAEMCAHGILRYLRQAHLID